jgi:hypothetical protein
MKLYETLALEPDLENKAKEARRTIARLFGNVEAFTKRIETYTVLLESEPPLQSKETAMAYTVEGLLADFQKEHADFTDISLTKEATNVATSADLIINGVKLATLPATALLNLENRLREIRDLYHDIPTIDPSGVWVFDDNMGLLKSGPYDKLRTKKVMKTLVKYEATKEHPAQTEVYTEDVPSYNVSETVWNSKLTIADKTDRLARIDKLLQETKAARLRANDVEVNRVRLADKLYNFINTGEFE